MFFVSYTAFSVGSNLWLSKWTDASNANQTDAETNMYLAVYGGFGGFQGTI